MYYSDLVDKMNPNGVMVRKDFKVSENSQKAIKTIERDTLEDFKV